MTQRTNKHVGKSKYKGVVLFEDYNGKIRYRYNKTIKGVSFRGNYDDEKECALQYDLCLIKNGLEPVNILKKKDD